MLLDIGLPGMNGYEVARRMRQSESLERATLIACTGYGQEADRRDVHRAGFDYHLVKPVDMTRLQQILTDVPSAKRGARTRVTASPASRTPKTH